MTLPEMNAGAQVNRWTKADRMERQMMNAAHTLAIMCIVRRAELPPDMRQQVDEVMRWREEWLRAADEAARAS
jgi:hypothetical protein